MRELAAQPTRTWRDQGIAAALQSFVVKSAPGLIDSELVAFSTPVGRVCVALLKLLAMRPFQLGNPGFEISHPVANNILPIPRRRLLQLYSAHPSLQGTQ
jgi:hypothetical protein